MHNPLLEKWDTPYKSPPFKIIKTGHFKPAIESAINSASDELKKITDNPEPPTFENTIEILDRTGDELGKIASILFNLNSAETNNDLQTVVQEISPRPGKS